MKTMHIRERNALVDDLPKQQTIECRWSEDRTTTYIDGLDELPEFMLKRLAESVFDKLPKTKFKIWFL